jgi:hypothetical protein
LEFSTPFGQGLNPKNRWILLSNLLPWDDLAKIYGRKVSPDKGAPTIDPRIVIGAIIIKHKMNLDDRGTIEMVQENPYMQYFLGLSGFQQDSVFDPSLFVALRNRIGFEDFEAMNKLIIQCLADIENPNLKRSNDSDNKNSQNKSESIPDSPINQDIEPTKITNKGILKIDATICDQNIAFPTDFRIVNESREQSEKLIDKLWFANPIGTKPRTKRKLARIKYLAIAKAKRPGLRKLRKAIGQQLRFLKRNLSHIDQMVKSQGMLCLKHKDADMLDVIKKVYDQQYEMWKNKTRRCEDRIVNIHQPFVRPMVRGKAGRNTEFGSKICCSIQENGISRLESIGWDAYNESTELIHQINAYHDDHGYYPEKIAVDQIYGSRENREWCKEKGIDLQVKPLGRPPKDKIQRVDKLEHRNDIEGKFGEAKTKYGLNKIKAKNAWRSESWISAIFLVMNISVLLRKKEKLMMMLLALIIQGLIHSSFVIMQRLSEVMVSFNHDFLARQWQLKVSPVNPNFPFHEPKFKF